MKKQRGVSLVELMVSITIGLLLLVGLGTIFVSINKTSSVRRGLSDLQNNQRMAMLFLDLGIRNAGFYPSPLTVTAPTTPITGTGTGTVADTLSVSFVASTGVTGSQGCSGQLNAGDSYTDTFSVPLTGANAYTLICVEQDSGPTANSTTTYPLIGGLEGLKVSYGVDTTCSGSVNEYLAANSVPTATWTSVCPAPLGSKIKTVTTELTFTNPLKAEQSTHPTITLTQTTPYMSGL